VQQYAASEVEKLLQLPRSTIRALIKAGLVAPARGPRRVWMFSFKDLLVLRQARQLVAAKVPPWRVARALKELRRQAESGQYALAFEAAPAGPRALGKRAAQTQDEARESEVRARPDDPVQLYNRGVQLEDLGRRKDALAAYQAALRGDPSLADCHYNLGLLYESLGRKRDAIRHLSQYRRLTRRPK
jgi:tetratricopeptide (TPR) repeat protein